MKTNYIDLSTLKYEEIDNSLLNQGKPLICLTSRLSDLPNDYDILVFDARDNLRTKFNNLDYAKEYAAFLADHV